ncbi:MAG: rRNA maturation RNase YbeY, partial [Candidatus Electrothrix sp. AUS1_2]|nr:rRNA maturation RNase YbeY [Candidatus Electrothrix sp. AUS1_2]
MPVNIISTQQEQHPTFHLHEDLLRDRILFLLQKIGRADSTVSVVFMDDPTMTAYNQQYRSKPGPTNVLSFPAAEGQDIMEGVIPNELAGDELGDILISVETAQKEALEKKCTLHQRLTELLIHGLLHLIGYDHEISDEQADIMFNRENKLLRSLQEHHIYHMRRNNMPQLAINV